MNKRDYLEDLIVEFGVEYADSKMPDMSLNYIDDGGLEQFLVRIADEWSGVSSDIMTAFDIGRTSHKWSSINSQNAEFDKTDKYFAIDGDGSLVSIAEVDLGAFLLHNIDADKFIEWCDQKGYTDYVASGDYY